MQSYKNYLTRGRILLTQGRIKLGSFGDGTEGKNVMGMEWHRKNWAVR